MSDPTNLIFSDTFTEAAGNPLLTAHTPDIGTGWTKLLGDAGKFLYVTSSPDRVEVSSDAYSPFGYVISDTPAGEDTAAEMLWGIDQLNNGNAFLAVGLQTDGGSDLKYYGVGLHPATPEFRLYRYVSGTQVMLGSPAAGALNDQIRIKRVGVFVSVERFSGGSWSTIIGPVDETGTLITGGKPGIAWDLPGDRIVGDNFNAYDDGGGAAVLTASPGSYTLSGQSTGLLGARKLAAGAGSYVLGGQDAELRRQVTVLPVVDFLNGSWRNEVGASALAASLDEFDANDSDFIISIALAPGQSDTCRIGFASTVDPGVHTDHQVSYRYRRANLDGAAVVNLTVTLGQGSSTQIAQWQHFDIGDVFTTVTQTLSTAEASAITSYASGALWLEFKGEGV